ncbi:MAG: lysophospholipid acyltransferase family protein [Candidatus Xenobia bacterium]
MSDPRLQTRELAISISEEEAPEPAVPAPEKAPRKRPSRLVRILRVRGLKARKKKAQVAHQPLYPPVPEDADKMEMPAPGKEWQLAPSIRLLRGPVRDGILQPVLNLFCKLHIIDGENFKGVRAPVILASNHTSHFDTPVIFEVVPPGLRNRLATAAAADHWFKNKTKGILPGLAYGAIPFPRKGSLGLKHCIELLKQGWGVLIFPEGTRSKTGEMVDFRPGIGRMAVATGVSIVPLHVRGLHRILPKTSHLPRRGDVYVAVGPPITPQQDETAEALTARIQAAVRHLGTLIDPYDDGSDMGQEPPVRDGLY